MLFISCHKGLEPLLKTELEQLGIPDVRLGVQGVFAPQTMECVYKINYGSRLATRVFWPLAHFSCPDRDALYAATKKIVWEEYFTKESTFAIDAVVTPHPMLRNSHFAALVVKDGLCDRLRDQWGSRPSVQINSPDVQLHLFIHQGKATISFDTSGTPLFKRGWRRETGDAPIQESLAAAILMQAGWGADDILCDPFCGSGTILVEAALMATATPPGFFRTSWGFLRMPSFSAAEWEAVKSAADAKRQPLQKGKIFGSDADATTLGRCRQNLRFVGFEKEIELQQQSVESYIPKAHATLIVTNPPYGMRIQRSQHCYEDLLRLTKRLESRTFFLVPSDVRLPGFLNPSMKKCMSLLNGGTEVNLVEFIS